MKRKHAWQPVYGVAALVVALVATVNTEAAEKKPIRIGVSISLTTDYALAGLQQKAGIEMAVDEINRAGGVPGKGENRPVQLVYGDNAMSPTTAVNALNRILSDDPVAVLQTIRGTQVLPQLPLLQRAKTAGLTLSGTLKVTQQNNNFVYRFYPHDGLNKPVLTRYVVEKLGKKKIGIFYSAEDYGSSGRDEIVKTLKELGIEPVAVESHQPTDKDFAAQLEKFRSSGAQVIILQTFQAPSALILKQARQMNLGIPFALSSQSVAGSALKLVEPQDIEGYYAETAVVDPPFSMDPKVKAWAAEIEKRYSIVPDYQAILDYDATKMLIKAIELYGPDRAAIVDGLHKMKYRGLVTEYQSDPTGNMNHEVSIVEIRGKKQIEVGRVKVSFTPYSN